MPARNAPSVAYSPAIVHAAYLEAGSVRKAAGLLGIPKSVVSDLLLGKSKEMGSGTADKVARTVANDLDRNTRSNLVGTANVLRDRARGGDAARLAAERVNLQLHTPQERRRMVRDRQRQQSAADAEYQRFISSQRERVRSPARVPTRGMYADPGQAPLFGDLLERT